VLRSKPLGPCVDVAGRIASELARPRAAHRELHTVLTRTWTRAVTQPASRQEVPARNRLGVCWRIVVGTHVGSK
jgi:hypothetical protein